MRYLFYMVKFVITEEEKRHIRNLYEQANVTNQTQYQVGQQLTAIRSLDNKVYTLKIERVDPNGRYVGAMINGPGNYGNKKLDGTVSYELSLNQDGSLSGNMQMGNFVIQKNQQQSTQQITQQTASKPQNVKAFQDWMDRYYPTWLKGGKLNKGRGYGTFGPNTTKAWNTYQNQYLGKK
jgi:hypothetical protein